MSLLRVADAFPIEGSAVSCEKLGNGHINRTYLVTSSTERRYVLQGINTGVFKDVDVLMNNIFAVTRYLSGAGANTLRFLTTREGQKYLSCEEGVFRLYEYVEGMSLEKASSPRELNICGRAFGGFQKLLGGFDADQLGETIPRFHDTVKRVNDLVAAAEKDVRGRLKTVREEYDFYISRRRNASIMLDMQAAGQLRTRVTHNDTKLNNVLLDANTLAPVCVIDLDTIMPGLAGNDFGDCIRSGATTGAEDEPDLSKVSLDLEMYRAFAGGFLSACAGELTQAEIDTLPWGAYLMTYECGARFLTDYLSGDVYFATAYPEHNLVRCRTQMKLVKDTEDNFDKIRGIICEEAANI
ncbi:MAG: aminoglycoside phosphotransferase family protein [Clostridiales bacterium]|nr:aminoglycoside phosphotransferase family protein [Clostridiales bacterium]